MVIDQIFSRMDGCVMGLVAELRAANRERNVLRLGMQTIIDLHAGGEAEWIARQMLEKFGPQITPQIRPQITQIYRERDVNKLESMLRSR